MVEEKAHAGIQKLLQAEQEAAEVVAAAKAEKVMMLKKAKEDADQEIAAYKQERERLFQIFSKERMGDTGTHSKETASATERQLSDIQKQVAANKGRMADMLLQSVTTVAL